MYNFKGICRRAVALVALILTCCSGGSSAIEDSGTETHDSGSIAVVPDSGQPQPQRDSGVGAPDTGDQPPRDSGVGAPDTGVQPPRPCSPTNPAGTCAGGSTCVAGACCIVANVCGAQCCGAGATCISGQCCTRPCGANCCNVNATCIDDGAGNLSCANNCTGSAECTRGGECCALLSNGSGACLHNDPARTQCLCRIRSECGGSQACAPIVANDLVTTGQYVCKPNDATPWNGCHTTAGTCCPGGYSCWADARDNRFCTRSCGTSAQCGTSPAATCNLVSPTGTAMCHNCVTSCGSGGCMPR